MVIENMENEVKYQKSKHDRKELSPDMDVAIGIVEAAGGSPDAFTVDIMKKMEQGALSVEDAVKEIEKHHHVG